MRYDTPIYFQKITQGAYNPDTGNYGPDRFRGIMQMLSIG